MSWPGRGSVWQSQAAHHAEEGRPSNQSQTDQRNYNEEGLASRRKRRRKGAAGVRVTTPSTVRPNQKWSMDFVTDTPADQAPFAESTETPDPERTHVDGPTSTPEPDEGPTLASISKQITDFVGDQPGLIDQKIQDGLEFLFSQKRLGDLGSPGHLEEGGGVFLDELPVSGPFEEGPHRPATCLHTCRRQAALPDILQVGEAIGDCDLGGLHAAPTVLKEPEEQAAFLTSMHDGRGGGPFNPVVLDINFESL